MASLNVKAMCASLIYFILWRVGSCLVAFDCRSGNVNMTSVSLIELPNCEVSVPNITTTRELVAVTQIVQFSEIDYIRCHIEEFHNVWRCGRAIDTGLDGGFYSSIPSISRDECEKLVKDNIYTVYGDNGKLDIFTGDSGRQSHSYTSRGYINQGGSCTPGSPFTRLGKTYDRPVQNTRVEIRFSAGKARLSHDDDVLMFPTGFGCKYSDGQCKHAESGHLFWKKKAPECSDKNDKSLIYSGYGNVVVDNQHTPPSQFLQVSYEGYDFQIQMLPQTDFVCGYRSSLTEHPRLFVTILSKDGPLFPLTKKVTPVDVNLLNYVNSKIVYSMRHTKQEVDRLFRQFELDRCKTQNRITTAMLSLATQDPIEFSYLYFQAPGYTAVTRGEVVHIAKCTEVAVEIDTITEGCFNELPVLYNNKTAYMSPKTRILIDVGKIVSCLPDLAPRFLINGVWITRTPHGLMRVERPTVMSHESIHYSFMELRGLSTGGLYTQDTIQKYQEILTSPMVENVITSRLADAVGGRSTLPEGYQFSSGFSNEDYSSIKLNIGTLWDRILSKFSKFGEAVSAIIGLVIFVKVIIYILSCILNFKVMYDTFGLFTALGSFWWETLCNVLLHKRSSAGKRSQANIELDNMIVGDGY